MVSTEWLAAHLADESVRVVDSSWYLPAMARDALAEHQAAHVPGAVHFNIDLVADTSTGLPHMLAAPDVFAKAVGDMGISADDIIVVYDGVGLFSAPRVWWNFKVMGARKTYILDGGFPKWLAEGHPTETGLAFPSPVLFSPKPHQSATITSAEVLAHAEGRSAQIVDMRPADRFTGAVAEPRPGLRSGHIPGSLNLHYAKLVDEGRLRSTDALRAVIAEAGIDPNKPVISSCGSGVTAAFLNLALSEIGVEDVRLYDGSWTEWGANAALPIAAG